MDGSDRKSGHQGGADYHGQLCWVPEAALVQDMPLKALIMECVSDWRDEFKFEVWGDVFAQGVKNLESLGMDVTQRQGFPLICSLCRDECTCD